MYGWTGIHYQTRSACLSIVRTVHKPEGVGKLRQTSHPSIRPTPEDIGPRARSLCHVDGSLDRIESHEVGPR